MWRYNKCYIIIIIIIIIIIGLIINVVCSFDKYITM